ncbi:NYN domain-containing protein [Pseudomonas sp. NFIX28]|uniref:NYN domain-containing protein n=1 Tax=Pseudomonas sp. NFIX28 TaxID=1566235 RepID=UPI000894724C|nr:NYN domain-containing protein [Pseudomonas sp. NFIX28]SDZ63524.1 hypothetical protein SAMN03159453_05334 [Pseudomonas sp. NFIX28]
MRTAFFVDGYNLFYGLLAGTPYKWLDLPQLLAHIAHVENPASELVSKRPAPGSLKACAHWMRRVVTVDELQRHQFPERVPTHKAPAIKPGYW